MDKFFYMNNGKPFTAIDKDNDRLSGNCAQFRDFGYVTLMADLLSSWVNILYYVVSVT